MLSIHIIRGFQNGKRRMKPATSEIIRLKRAGCFSWNFFLSFGGSLSLPFELY